MKILNFILKHWILSSAILLIFAAVLLPLGLYIFRIALRAARRDGTLVQY